MRVAFGRGNPPDRTGFSSGIPVGVRRC